MNLNDPQLEGLIAQLGRQNNIQLDPHVVRNLLGTIQNQLKEGALGPTAFAPRSSSASSSATTTPIDPAAEVRQPEWARNRRFGESVPERSIVRAAPRLASAPEAG